MRFMIIGTLNALIIAGVVAVMNELLHCNYVISNIVAYTLAQIHNFLWCRYWIFISPDRKTTFGQQALLFLRRFRHGLWGTATFCCTVGGESRDARILGAVPGPVCVRRGQFHYKPESDVQIIYGWTKANGRQRVPTVNKANYIYD